MATTTKATQKYTAEGRLTPPVDPLGRLLSSHEDVAWSGHTTREYIRDDSGAYDVIQATLGADGRPLVKESFVRHMSGSFNAARREADMRQWLKVREVAEVLAAVGITEAGVRDLLRSKDLHGNQPAQDGWWRIPLVSLRQYLTSNGTYLPEQIDTIMAEATALIQCARNDSSNSSANRATSNI